MSVDVRFTPHAQRHLRKISDQSEAKWGTTHRDRYIREIRETIELLAENPGIGRKRDDIRPNLLCYPANNHLVFIRRHPTYIEIIAILHNKMDLKKYL